VSKNARDNVENGRKEDVDVGVETGEQGGGNVEAKGWSALLRRKR